MAIRTKSILFLTAVYSLVFALGVFTGLAFADEGQAADGSSARKLEYNHLSELANARLGDSDSSIYNQVAEGYIDGIDEEDFRFFGCSSDELFALTTGKIDAFFLDKATADLWFHERDDVGIIPEELPVVEYGFFFHNGSQMRDQFDKALEDLRRDGKIEALQSKWFSYDASAKTIDWTPWDAPNGTLRMATSGTSEPLSYLSSDGIAGYEVEVAMECCKALGYGLKVDSMTSTGTFVAVGKGEDNFGGGAVAMTPERSEWVDFTTPIYRGPIVAVVRAESQEGFSAAVGAIPTIKDSFERALLQENRWHYILVGLGVTLLISVCSGVLGLLLGFFTVMQRRNGARWLNRLVTIYQVLMGSLPIVVVLMLLYYVVFGAVDIAAEIVAILAFSLSFGAASGSTMWEAVESLDPGIEESGLALGYSRRQVFLYVMLPQASLKFLPQLLSHFINLVQATSVVGFIALQDLTRASDLIRSFTMDAFFPLMVTAIVYLVICLTLTGLLQLVASRLKVENRSRRIKGVIEQN